MDCRRAILSIHIALTRDQRTVRRAYFLRTRMIRWIPCLKRLKRITRIIKMSKSIAKINPYDIQSGSRAISDLCAPRSVKYLDVAGKNGPVALFCFQICSTGIGKMDQSLYRKRTWTVWIWIFHSDIKSWIFIFLHMESISARTFKSESEKLTSALL